MISAIIAVKLIKLNELETGVSADFPGNKAPR
jgi:hypothetical protein